MEMKRNYFQLIMVVLLPVIVLWNCTAFRSEIKGKFSGPQKISSSKEKVSLLFVFSHYRQVKGYDAIPKLANKNQRVSDFDDFLRDALNEFKSVENYATFTEYPSDVNNPQRRAKKDSLINTNDFTLKIEFKEEISFTKYMLGGIFSTLSATLLPVPYTRTYAVKAQLFNDQGKLVNTYTRQASITKWVELLLIFAYPFYPERKEIESVYLEFLHDIFKQIEQEKALVKNQS